MTSIVKYQESDQDLNSLRSLAQVAAKSGHYPNMSEMTILNLMLSARDLGVSAYKALNGGFYVVNGKISMSTALMADRIRKAGHSIKITEWTSEKCCIIGIRKDNGDSVKFEYTMQDAQLAGLNSSPTWKKYPKQMLYNRAMSTLARTLFPDVIGNAYSEDEKWDIMDVPPENRPEEDPDSISVVTCSVAEGTSDVNVLRQMLEDENISPEHLDDYLRSLSEKHGKPVEKVVESATNPKLFPKFSIAYAKEVERRSVSAS